MKKYLHVFKIEFIHFLQYRSEFIAELISVFIRLFVVLFFAIAVYENKAEIYGYTLSTFATYSLLTTVMQRIVDSDVNWVLAEQIRKGGLANFLVKPIKYNWYRLFAELSWKSHSLFYNFLVIGILTIFYAKTFTLQIVSSRIILFIIAAAISFFFNRAIKYIIGTLGFWTKDIGGISSFLNEFIGLLGGSWLPLDFLSSFATILKLLPFSYIYYFPIQILMNPSLTANDTAKILLLEISWTLLFFFIGKVLWNKGLKRFESVGT